MWAGTVYVSMSAYPVFKEHFLGRADVPMSGFFYPIYMLQEMWAQRYEERWYGNSTKLHPVRTVTGFHFHNLVSLVSYIYFHASFNIHFVSYWNTRYF